MSVYDLVNQVNATDKAKLEMLVTFTVLRRYLTCDFADFIRALSVEIPPCITDVLTALDLADFSEAQKIQLIAGYLEAQNHGTQINYAEFAYAAAMAFKLPVKVGVTQSAIPTAPVTQPAPAPTVSTTSAPVPFEPTNVSEDTLPDEGTSNESNEIYVGARVSYNDGTKLMPGFVQHIGQDGTVLFASDGGHFYENVAPYFIQRTTEPVVFTKVLNPTTLDICLDCLKDHKYNPNTNYDRTCECLAYFAAVSAIDGSPATLSLDLMQSSETEEYSLLFHLDKVKAHSATQLLVSNHDMTIKELWTLHCNNVLYELRLVGLSADNSAPNTAQTQQPVKRGRKKAEPTAEANPTATDDGADVNDNMTDSPSDEPKKRTRRTKKQMEEEKQAAEAAGLTVAQYRKQFGQK